LLYKSDKANRIFLLSPDWPWKSSFLTQVMN